MPKCYIADRRSSHKGSGGWQVMWWDESRQIYVEGAMHRTKALALESLREDRERSRAAAALGARGGSAGRGESKRRTREQYQEMARRSAEVRAKKAE